MRVGMSQGSALPLKKLQGWRMHINRKKALAAGLNGHIVKPIDIAAWMAVLKEV